MRRAFVAASRAAFNVIYRLAGGRTCEREDLCVFLSRQADEPSYDFSELARELEGRGWKCVMHLKKVRARNIVAYAAHVMRELRLLARCKMAVLDRYDPVVSLLDFECEEAPRTAGDAGGVPTPRNLDFPTRPLVLQVWHAFGAYKKFGYQSVGTAEGHTAEFTSVYDIHRNYSWVLCSGPGARGPFAEAFSCPVERVVPLVRPEYDELVRARGRREVCADTQAEPFSVLMAPTLRKSRETEHPFRELFAARDTLEDGLDARISWSFHPLEAGLPAPGNVSAELLHSDCLVTDYSSIAYEAWVLGVPVIFYVPDLESYRISPGLNADPGASCPALCTRSARELKERLAALAADPGSYPFAELASFASTGFDPGTDTLPGTAASRIVDFALSKLPQGNAV